MNTSGTTTTTGLTLRWRRERLLAVKQKRILLRAARSYPCQSLAACIIATTSPPELLPRKSPLDSTEACGRDVPAKLSRLVRQCFHGDSSSPSPPVRVENPPRTLPPSSESAPSQVRMDFWRGPRQLTLVERPDCRPLSALTIAAMIAAARNLNGSKDRSDRAGAQILDALVPATP